MTYYFCIALGFWLGAALVREFNFKGEEFPSMLLGVIGCVFWPVMLFMTWLDLRDRRKP